jgi:hypothetical protein
MNRVMKKPIAMLLCAVLLAGVAGLRPAAADYDRSELEQDRQQVEKTMQKYGITEALGPLAPVALSPFFGLACLSGASILSEWGWLPENDFLQGNEVLNNPLVFLLFAALTIVTSVPKLVSVSKVFAEAADRLETYAGIISYAVVLLAARQTPEPDTVVYAAGVFAVTNNGLLAVMAAVNIFVISTVRLFFELLVLVSPVPLLDAIFEVANKTIAAVLMAIYLANPWLAFVLNLVIFAVCLLIFRWVNRRLRYYKAILLEPIWASVVHKLFGRPQWEPDWKMKRSLARAMPGIDLVVKCFPSRRLDKIRKKDRCYLVFTAEGLSLVRPHCFKPPLTMPLDPAQLTADIAEGLTAYWLTLAHNEKPAELVFSRVYTDKLDQIRQQLTTLKANNPLNSSP